MWLAALGLLSTGLSAYGQMQAGKSAARSAQINAYNLETQRVMSQAEALQRHNDRLDQYRSNLSANLATFAAQGRDIGSDRSVAAFLEKQKEVAASDTARSDLMGFMEANKFQAEAASVRREGQAQQTAARINAFTTLAGGLYRYQQTRT
jgi:hypothetical protein